MTLHAILGASSAHRWMKCPGSVRQSEGIVGRTSEAARLGTTAHELAEMCLNTDRPAETYLGWDLETGTVDEEMVRGVQLYLDTIDEIRGSHPYQWDMHVEKRVSLERLNPPAPMYGTADCILIDEHDEWLFIVDYKHGTGHVVEVKDNPQVKYYALAAALTTDFRGGKVRTIIVQPRAPHPDGPVRSYDYTMQELLAFGQELLAAARATQDPNAMLVPGDHCIFCPAKATCPAQHSLAVTVAQTEFEAMPAELPPAPDTLTDEQLALVLEKAPIIASWLASVARHVEHRSVEGNPVPGFKLVAKRANRKWAVDGPAIEEYLTSIGIDPSFLYEQKIKSPLTVEKLVKKAGVKDGLPVDLVEKKPSGYLVVPENDPRPEIVGTVEFLALPAGDDSDNDAGDE